MSLQQYVRQLKPRNESYIPPVDKIQTFLTESLKAAEWEKVICVAYNMKNGMSKEDAISVAEVGVWENKHDTVLPTGHQIVKNSFGKSTKGEMLHYGQDSGSISKGWDQYFIKLTGSSASGPTLTPKTDMRLPNANISLKKYGGSQLMSGKGSETLATLGFAYDNAPDSIKSEAFDKAWKQLNQQIVDDWVSFKLPKGGQIGKISRGKMKVDKEMKDKVEDALIKHKAMTNALIEIFENPDVKKEVVREAMTGRSKFSDKKAAATHMMKFGEDGSGEFIVIDDKLVNKYTALTKFNISFKTSGTGGTAWTALKGIYKEEAVNLDDILTESADETNKEFLEEGVLSRVAKTIKNWIVRFLKKVWEKIKKLLMKGLDIALNLFDKKMTVRGDGYSFGGF